ncbi:hypothetical protein [Clostridium sp. DJ247]|nr:hypothetical protein [Clostridium sp. DJ247]
MFIPGILGLLFMSYLMFLLLKNRLPRTLPKAETENEAFLELVPSKSIL